MHPGVDSRVKSRLQAVFPANGKGQARPTDPTRSVAAGSAHKARPLIGYEGNPKQGRERQKRNAEGEHNGVCQNGVSVADRTEKRRGNKDGNGRQKPQGQEQRIGKRRGVL